MIPIPRQGIFWGVVEQEPPTGLQDRYLGGGHLLHHILELHGIGLEHVHGHDRGGGYDLHRLHRLGDVHGEPAAYGKEGQVDVSQLSHLLDEPGIAGVVQATSFHLQDEADALSLLVEGHGA